MNIQEIRKQHPEYADMNDNDLAQGIHKKFYADMPYSDFAQKVGVDPNPANIARDAGPDWGRAAAQMVGGLGASALQSFVEAPMAAASLGTSVPSAIPRVYAADALGQSIGGQAYDLAREYLGGAKPKTLPQRALDAGTDVAIGMAVPAAIDKVVQVAGKAGSAMLAPIKNKFAAAEPRQLLQDYKALGIDPMAGAISGNKGVQSMENMLADMPASARIMQGAAENTLGQTAAAAGKVAKGYGPTMTPQGAGEAIKGAAKGAVERFKSRSSDLYDAVGQFFGQGERVPVSNTLGMLKQQADEFAGAPELAKLFNKGLADIQSRIVKDAPDGMIDFAALKRLRSDVGESLGDAVNAVEDVNRASLKRLYASLSGDLEQAALSKGGAAERAYKLANRYYSLNQKTNIPTLEKVLQTKTDEAAYNLAVQGAKDGGTRLAVLRRNFQPEEWDVVAGTVLGRMGRATPGAQDAVGEVFSPATFLTNWNNIAPEAKAALFGGTRYKDLKPALDALTRVVGSQKATLAMANSSKTGSMLGSFYTLTAPLGAAASGGIGAGLGTAAATTVAPNVAARLMTNPEFINWLAKGATVSTKQPAGMVAHLARLPILAKESPEIRQAIGEYAAALGVPYKFE